MITSDRWKQEKLGNVIDTQKGFAFKSAWYCDDGRPIVKVSAFTQDSIDASALTKIPDEIAEKYLRYELKEGDVVIQTVGSWPSNPASVVGKCIRVPRSAHNALLNQNAVRLSPKSEVNNCYLYYALKAPQFFNYIVGTAQGAASQAAITLEAIRAYGLPIPSLPTQRKIASLLSAYDDLIENNLRRIKILEEMAQAIYRVWFVKFRFPGHEKVQMVDSPLGKIPEGWEIVPFKTLINCVRDGTNAGDHLSDRLYVPIDCIPRHSLTLLEAKHWKEAKSSLILFEEGDILFGAMRPYFHKVVVAPFKGVTRTTCFVLRPKTQLFLAYATMTAFQDETIGFASAQSRGATIPYAVWDGSLAEMDFLLPSELVITRFNDVLSPILRFFQTAYHKVFNLRRTRDLLLPKIISGELDVSDLDIKTGGHMQ